jgi:hypothetical protein
MMVNGLSSDLWRLIAKNGVESAFRLVPGAGKHILDSLFAVSKYLKCKIHNLILPYLTLSWDRGADLVRKMAVGRGEVGGGEVGRRSDGEGTAVGDFAPSTFGESFTVRPAAKVPLRSDCCATSVICLNA